jgi:hypothetical protein
LAAAAVNAMIAAEDAKVIDGKAGPAALSAREERSPEDALEAKSKRRSNRLMIEADTAVGPRERTDPKAVGSDGKPLKGAVKKQIYDCAGRGWVHRLAGRPQKSSHCS